MFSEKSLPHFEGLEASLEAFAKSKDEMPIASKSSMGELRQSDGDSQPLPVL